jgi:hypothetical protein
MNTNSLEKNTFTAVTGVKNRYFISSKNSGG